jgi:Putative metal-binding motif/FG-GAP repeat
VTRLHSLCFLLPTLLGLAACKSGDCWLDQDLDGVGGAQRVQCDEGPGLVGIGGDCDDLDPRLHPQAAELCDGIDNDCNGLIDETGATGGSAWYVDADGDGVGGPTTAAACEPSAGLTASAGDCDDDDPSVYPGAVERCDGVDQDCDEQADEGAVDAPIWHADADGDSFGDPNQSTSSCEAPIGFVSDGTDCADHNSEVSPAGVEVCNGLDDDCDGQADERDAVDALTWYADRDGDGQGSADDTALSCWPPEGAAWLLDSSDCDDTDIDVSTYGVEVCDGVDQDCDGVVDEDASDLVRQFVDADLDGYGVDGLTAQVCRLTAGWSQDKGDCDDADASVYPGAIETWYDGVDGDCDESNDYDWDLDGYEADSSGGSDCDDTDALVNPDAPEVCADSADNDCDGDVDGQPCRDTLDRVGFRLTGEAKNDQLGVAVDGGGDVNGDGIADLIVGAYGEDSGSATAGASYIFHGPLTASLSALSADAKLQGTSARGMSGSAVAFVGDMDGDGTDDVLVGAPSEGVFSYGYEGAAYLMLSPSSGTTTLNDADARIQGPHKSALLGTDLAPAGDVDGDGWFDLIIGSPGMDPTPYGDVGLAVLVLGPVTGDIRDLTLAHAQLLGAAVGDEAGAAVAGGSDLDGDGIDDVVVGAYGAEVGLLSAAGRAYVVSDPPAGDFILTDAQATLSGRAEGDRFGAGLATPGDVNGDGQADLLVGAPYESTGASEGGAVFVFHGPLGGELDAGDAAAILVGTVADAYLGLEMDDAGDVNGDGQVDLVLGARRHGGAGGDNTGAAYLASGPLSGTLDALALGPVMEGPAAGDYAGYSVAGGGDLDGDGLSDLLVGALSDDTAASAAGALYVVPGWSW